MLPRKQRHEHLRVARWGGISRRVHEERTFVVRRFPLSGGVVERTASHGFGVMELVLVRGDGG